MKSFFRKQGDQEETVSETTLDHSGELDPDAVLREKDKESAWRKLQGPWLAVVILVSVVFMGYHVYTSRFGMPIVMKHRALHVGFVLFLIWLYFPATKKSPKHRPSVVDIGLLISTVIATIYTIINVEPFALRGGVALPSDHIFGAITIVLVLEACRRVVGKGLLILAIVFLLYAYVGNHIPGVLSHRGYTLERIIYQMYLTGQGIYGIPIGISATYLVVFIILGAMLEKSGLGKLFNDLALAVGGRLTGGPAKVSVFASALMGTISGSAATNVATTGAFTIPLMKRVGYKPAFAGAAEAAASTGGQIMPPIMGTAAFIMAEYLGVPYLSIAAAAVIPAILYFAGVYFQIDLRARRTGMRALTKEELPDAKATVLRYGHMFIPIIVLVALLMNHYTPIYAAFYSIVITWALSFIRKETRIGPKKLVEMSVNAARSTLSVAIAMATAGFIVAVLSMTGVGVVLADNIVLLSKGILFVALVLTMIVSIILGMGLPTSACYIIAASIAVPILTNMGVAPFQAHFFIMYFSILSTITPPVALASYVGAGMAGADPNKVGITAFRLALAGFIIPFFFVYSPAMLLIAENNWVILWATVTSLVGTFILAIAVEGYFLIVLPIWSRVLFFLSAVTLIAPGLKSDIVGMILVSISFASVLFLRKKRMESISTST